MTDEELAKKYYEAAENALLYGTGLIKVVMVDNKFVAAVVDPKDYWHLPHQPDTKEQP